MMADEPCVSVPDFIAEMKKDWEEEREVLKKEIAKNLGVRIPTPIPILSPELEDYLTNYPWDNPPFDDCELVTLLGEWALSEDSAKQLLAKLGLKGMDQMVAFILERYYSYNDV